MTRWDDAAIRAAKDLRNSIDQRIACNEKRMGGLKDSICTLRRKVRTDKDAAKQLEVAQRDLGAALTSIGRDKAMSAQLTKWLDETGKEVRA